MVKSATQMTWELYKCWVIHLFVILIFFPSPLPHVIHKHQVKSCGYLTSPRQTGGHPLCPEMVSWEGYSILCVPHCSQECIVKESESEVAPSCLTLCDPMDGSPPGSSIHGIFQARILEWVAISFSTRMHNLYLIRPSQLEEHSVTVGQRAGEGLRSSKMLISQKTKRSCGNVPGPRRLKETKQNMTIKCTPWP